jgi:hypothetical protein
VLSRPSSPRERSAPSGSAISWSSTSRRSRPGERRACDQSDRLPSLLRPARSPRARRRPRHRHPKRGRRSAASPSIATPATPAPSTILSSSGSPPTITSLPPR